MKSLSISNLITSRENDSFKKYLKEVSKIKAFTPEEEALCAVKAYNGDNKAKEELVTRNLKFVISVAKQYVTPQSPLEDLVNEGNLGLILAAERFNPAEKVKFISYAVWWIRKVIIEHINKYNRAVRLPLNKITSLSKLDKMVSDLEQKKGYKVDIHELADELGSDEFNALEVLTTYKMDSLDRQLGGEDGDGSTLIDLLADNTIKGSDHLVTDSDHKTSIFKGLNVLKERDKQIIILLFGLDGKEPRTLQEVSDVVGMSREMVRQVKMKSLLKLSKDNNLKTAYTEL